MYNIFCPLCKGSDIKKVETINAKDLNDIYFENYHIEIMYLFKQDKLYYCKCESCFLKFFEPTAIGDEYFYNVLQKNNKLYYMDNKEEYEFASKYIMQSDDVLDIGCGKAAFSKKINYKSFTGLELSTNAKELAKQEGVNIINQTIQEHCVNNNEKYNVVCSFQVLEHVDCNELFEFLKAAIGCLKKNGLLIISVPSDDSYLSKCVNSTLNLPPHHQTHWPDRTLKEMAKIFNLDIIDLHHDALSHRSRTDYLYQNVKYLLSTKHTLINKKINLLQKIGLRLIKVLNGKMQHFIINSIKPYGHSITVIYKKAT